MGFLAAIPAWAVAATSIATTVGGAVMQGMAQSQAADYQAQVARNNQIIANQNAGAAIQQGQVAEDAQRQKTAQLIGAITAQQAPPRRDHRLRVRIRRAFVRSGNRPTRRSHYHVQCSDEGAGLSNSGVKLRRSSQPL